MHLKAFQLKGENYAPGTLVITRGENPELNIDSLIIQSSKGLTIEMSTCQTG